MGLLWVEHIIDLNVLLSGFAARGNYLVSIWRIFLTLEDALSIAEKNKQVSGWLDFLHVSCKKKKIFHKKK